MSCPIPPPPPQTAPLTSLPPDAHAYAQAFLDEALATGLPAGTYRREVHNGVALVKQFTRHTTCNGTQNACCPAVSLFADTSLPGTPDGATSAPVDWALVAGTGAAATAVVTLFVLALRHAGRHPRRYDRRS